MAAFRRDTTKRRWTAKSVIVTALVAFAGTSKIEARAAPGDFNLWGVATGAGSVEVVVFVPEEKNGLLDSCYGTLSGPDQERHFNCDDHGGKSSTVTLKGLEPETEYNCTVTFINELDECDEAATTKSITIKTQAEPTEQDPSFTTRPNRNEPAAGMVFLPTPTVVIFSTSTLVALWQRHLSNNCMNCASA